MPRANQVPSGNFLPTIAGLGAHPILVGDVIGEEEDALLKKKAQEQAFERTLTAPKVLPRTYSSRDLEREGMPGGEFVDVGGSWARRQDLPALAGGGNTEAFMRLMDRAREDATIRANATPAGTGYVMNDVLPASAVGSFRNLIGPGGGGGQVLDDAGALRDTMMMRQGNQARSDQARSAVRQGEIGRAEKALMDTLGLGVKAGEDETKRMAAAVHEYDLKVRGPQKDQAELEKEKLAGQSRKDIALIGAKSLQRTEDYKEMQEFLKVPRTKDEIAALKRAQAERANTYDATRTGVDPSAPSGKWPPPASPPDPKDVVSKEQERIDAETEGNAQRTFLREALGLARDTDPVGAIDVNKITAAMAKRGSSLQDSELDALIAKIRSAGGGENLVHKIVADYIRLSRAAGLEEGAGQWKINDTKRGGAWHNDVTLKNLTDPEFSGASIGGKEASGWGTKALGTAGGIASMILPGLGLGAGGAALLGRLGYSVPVAATAQQAAGIGGAAGVIPGMRLGEWASGTENMLPTFTQAGREQAKREALQVERFLNKYLKATYAKKKKE